VEWYIRRWIQPTAPSRDAIAAEALLPFGFWFYQMQYAFLESLLNTCGCFVFARAARLRRHKTIEVAV